MPEDGTGVRKVAVTTPGVLDGNTSLLYAIKNPLTFIHKTNTEGDWYANSETYQNNELWSDGFKSIYDPCPKGWRTPPNGTWNDYSIEIAPFYIQGNLTTSGNCDATNGRLYNSITWYPATGYRNCNTGILYSAGNDSGYSSSTGVEAKSSRNVLRIFLSSISVNLIANKAHGYAIRCIQE